MVALLYLIAKRELETIKVEIPDFPFFSHQLIVHLTTFFISNCLLDERIPKICKKLNSHSGFLSKIGRPIHPIWELNSSHIFAVPLSSRHDKYCQILERLFFVFHHSRNIPWSVSSLFQSVYINVHTKYQVYSIFGKKAY